MKITKLEYNLRGKTSTLKPAPVNVIVGDNAAGKSMVLAAVRLALLGKDNRLGGKANDAFALSDGKRMFVKAIIENGEVWNREWRAKPGGGCSYTDNMNDESSAQYAILLDPSEWLDSPAREKAEYLFSIAGDRLKEFSVLELIAKLKQGIKVENPTEASEKALSEMSDELLKAVGQEKRPQFVAAQLSEAISEKKKKVRFEKDSAEKAVSAATANAARDGLETAKNVDADLRKAKTEMERLSSERGRLSSELDALKRYEASASDRVLTYVPATPEPEYVPKPAPPAYVPKIDIDEYQKQYDRLNSIPAHVSGAMKIRIKLDEIKRAIARSEGYSNQITSEVNKSVEQFQIEQSKDRCPCCDVYGSVWKESHQAKHKAFLDQKASALKVLQDEQKSLSEQYEAGRLDLAAAEEADQQYEIVVSELKRIAGLLVEEKTARDFAANEAKKHIENEQSAKDFHAKRTARYAEDEKNRRAAFDRQQAALASLSKPEGDKAAIEGKLAEIVKSIEASRQSILLLEQAQKKWVAACSRKTEVEKHSANALRFEAEVEVWSQAEKGMKELQKAMMASVFGPILEAANLFTDGLLDAPLELQDMELGRKKDGRWIPYQVFSGFEKALTFAGLGVALAQSSPVKVVMMDEVNFGPENKAKIATRMGFLVQQKIIDHFFVTDITEFGWTKYISEGLQIIKA